MVDGHADVNKAHEDGRAPRWEATSNECSEIVQSLVGDGHADVNIAVFDGITTLWIMPDSGYCEVVQYLVVDGHADVNKADEFVFVKRLSGWLQATDTTK